MTPFQNMWLPHKTNTLGALTGPDLTHQILGIFLNKTLSLNLLNTKISVLIFKKKRATKSEIKDTKFIDRKDCLKLLL